MEFDFPASGPERESYICTTFLETLRTRNFSRRLRLIARVTDQEASILRRMLYDPSFRQSIENKYALAA
jgi:hypothetical protein